MDIKDDRDVLYSGKKIKNKKEASQIKTVLSRECPCHLLADGIMTVEAAFVVTVFFLFMFALMYLFNILFSVNVMKNELAGVVNTYECYGTKLGSVSTLLKESVVVKWDTQKKVCYVTQNEKIPSLGSEFFNVSWYQQLEYSDYDGESMVPDKKESEEFVYLAETGKVYHKNSSCTYLKPNIQKVFLRELVKRRNESGGRYYPCESCVGGSDPGMDDEVYITSYGNRWHVKRNCKKIKRKVRKVLISDIGDIPPCSKCGKGSD